MARGQVAWTQVQISESINYGTDTGTGTDSGSVGARGRVASSSISVPVSTTTGTDSGHGLDVGWRQSSSGTLVSAADTGHGLDAVDLFTGTGSLPRTGADAGFGFSRNSAAGLVFLWSRRDVPAVRATGNPSVFDSGRGIASSVLESSDRSLSVSDTGAGIASSTMPAKILTLAETGIGNDTGAFIPSFAATLPEVVLEVAFDSDPVDTDQAWTVVSSDSTGKQIEFSVKRGRNDELKDPETGTMLTALFNQSRDFDPAYTLSPYYPKLKPVRQVRLSAIRGSTTYQLFRGDVEEWPQQLEGRLNKVTLAANDAFDALSQVEVVDLDCPEEKTGARVQRLLNRAEWPFVDIAAKSYGQTTLHANRYSGNALELIRNAVRDEDGYLFAQGDGRVTFIERHERFKLPYTVPYVVLSNRPTGAKLPFSDVKYQIDKDFIRNQVKIDVEAILEDGIDSEGNPTRVTVQNEVTVFVEDEVSKTSYRPRTLTFSPSAIADLNEVEVKALYHLNRLKDPLVRVTEIMIEPQMHTDLWSHALGREIGDRIAVEIYPVQTGVEEVIYFEGIIEYVEHRYVVGHWQTTWKLSPADLNNYWILGDTVLGVLGDTSRLGY